MIWSMYIWFLATYLLDDKRCLYLPTLGKFCTRWTRLWRVSNRQTFWTSVFGLFVADVICHLLLCNSTSNGQCFIRTYNSNSIFHLDSAWSEKNKVRQLIKQRLKVKKFFLLKCYQKCKLFLTESNWKSEVAGVWFIESVTELYTNNYMIQNCLQFTGLWYKMFLLYIKRTEPSAWLIPVVPINLIIVFFEIIMYRIHVIWIYESKSKLHMT